VFAQAAIAKSHPLGMDTVVPATGQFARSVTAENIIKQTLGKGTWVYPQSPSSGTGANYSLVFDIILMVGFLAIWVYQAFTSGATTQAVRTELQRDVRAQAVKKHCLQGMKSNAANYRHMLTGVEFINKDEFASMLSLLVVSAFAFFKIICGAHGVNSGSILCVVLIVLFKRFMRQAGKDRVWFMLNTVMAILAVFVALLAYTGTVGNTQTGKNAGQNMTYFFSGAFLLIASAMKFVLCIRPELGVRTIYGKKIDNREDSYDRYLTERSYTIVDGDWLYELTGTTVIVIGGSLTSFLFCESLVIAMAATKWYALPFYALYPIPMYFLGAVGVQVYKNRNNNLAHLFNATLVILGFAIMIMLQGHACSLPSSESEHWATGHAPYCLRIGLEKSTDSGLKLNVGAAISLQIMSALFILMIYMSMLFTSINNISAVDTICEEEYTDGSSGVAFASDKL
jgi:hypothetical protein